MQDIVLPIFAPKKKARLSAGMGGGGLRYGLQR